MRRVTIEIEAGRAVELEVPRGDGDEVLRLLLPPALVDPRGPLDPCRLAPRRVPSYRPCACSEAVG